MNEVVLSINAKKSYFRKNILRPIIYSAVLFGTISFFFGCDNIKPIWTEEGWQNYKESVYVALIEALKVVLWGVIPSAIGLICSRSALKQRSLMKKGIPSKWLIIKMYLFPLISLTLTLSFFFSGHWLWGILSIVSFFLGFFGILVLPPD
jgi:hypothetical protein